jgi:hypothetical protein
MSWDPPDLAAALRDDPMERAALVEGAMRWKSPEDAVGFLTANGGRDCEEWWTGLRPPERHLYRRRVAAILSTSGAVLDGATD